MLGYVHKAKLARLTLLCCANPESTPIALRTDFIFFGHVQTTISAQGIVEYDVNRLELAMAVCP
ncbi:hypothetical protein XI04_08310 [Bradyrhizobium sp. CCBAU 11430]|nr:hypothetical protein [Bradyrhizobium sp. CCBAU 11430]